MAANGHWQDSCIRSSPPDGLSHARLPLSPLTGEGEDLQADQERLQDAFEKLHQELVTDPEKSVREAARRAWEERRGRSWANQHLSVVLEVEGNTNKEILRSWCYGDALTRVGDDACIRVLREHVSQNSHPPNVGYWLRRILEQMKENWRKTTQDWPEPWFAWEGTINEGQGQLIASEDEAFEINYSIWAQPWSAPSDPPRSTWGGAMWPLPFHALQDVEEATIELDDGSQGRLFIKRSSGDMEIQWSSADRAVSRSSRGSSPIPRCPAGDQQTAS